MAPHPETTPVPSSSPTTSPARQPKKPPCHPPCPPCPPCPPGPSHFALPTLRLEIRQLTHPGANLALNCVNPAETLATAARNVLRLLYSSPASPTTTAPPTRSVTLILRDMPGVAYATGIELDGDHKEIHLSLDHVLNTSRDRTAQEITGVITHELVHCLQWNGFGTCPSGLIEGIADWVRLNCDLAPPHWKKEPAHNWDAGYQHTAYFLNHLEVTLGDGFVRALNEKLRIEKYAEHKFWMELTGRTVHDLFTEYVEGLQDER
ncbi:PBSP domain protein [Metarhizium album ARSEF 1941]|uniref:PBSP domain protein n=1 Tax=Metarhizium album (strain ARSEF 1941) TaxID=1081103 RepID=A0A0B2WMI4_METAS|nr:PBSP domain protein [Metarhizium album ARSEF 1941]KHN94225.1 PBSP domain protein [Metarhizium album ARSEF 1941]